MQQRQNHGAKLGQNLEKSIEDDFLIPDDMANYLSEVQNGSNQMRFGYDPTRPSTCPPPSSGGVYGYFNNSQCNLPPPPSYNQAINGSMNFQQGPMQQQQQLRRPFYPNQNQNFHRNFPQIQQMNSPAAYPPAQGVAETKLKHSQGFLLAQ